MTESTSSLPNQPKARSPSCRGRGAPRQDPPRGPAPATRNQSTSGRGRPPPSNGSARRAPTRGRVARRASGAPCLRPRSGTGAWDPLLPQPSRRERPARRAAGEPFSFAESFENCRSSWRRGAARSRVWREGPTRRARRGRRRGPPLCPNRRVTPARRRVGAGGTACCLPLWERPAPPCTLKHTQHLWPRCRLQLATVRKIHRHAGLSQCWLRSESPPYRGLAFLHALWTLHPAALRVLSSCPLRGIGVLYRPRRVCSLPRPICH